MIRKIRILSKRCSGGRIRLSWQFFCRKGDTLLASMFLNPIERAGLTWLAVNIELNVSLIHFPTERPDAAQEYYSRINSGHAKHVRLNFAVSGGMSPRPLHFSCGVVGLIMSTGEQKRRCIRLLESISWC